MIGWNGFIYGTNQSIIIAKRWKLRQQMPKDLKVELKRVKYFGTVPTLIS